MRRRPGACASRRAASPSSTILHPAAPAGSAAMPAWVIARPGATADLFELDPDLGRRRAPFGQAGVGGRQDGVRRPA